MGRQHEQIIFEMEKRGGRIRTSELRTICCQYQARLKELREKFGYAITPAIKTQIKGEREYVLLSKPGANDSWTGAGVQRPLL